MRFFRLKTVTQIGLAAALALGASFGAAQAQNLFAPARKVDERVISNYDVAQRMTFLEVLNSAGADPRREAIQRLTEESVQRSYAMRKGFRVTPDELADGMAEFASRAELSTEEFVAALAGAGVERETFVNFVEAGLLWRKVVGREFPALVSVSPADVARAQDTAAILGRQRVLMSEIFLPTDPEFAEAVAQIMDMIESARSIEEFSRLAREFSLAGSRDQGGRLDWVPLENLPGQIGGPISAARPGQIIGPIALGGAVAYFQLRATDSSRDIPADRVEVNYQRLLLPGGRSEDNLATAARIQAEVRHCTDFARFARDLPEEALIEREALMTSVPSSDAVELARLDRNEISFNTTDGSNLVVLMLCARQLQFDEPVNPAQVEASVFDRRIGGMADLRLQELIADAVIVDF